MAKMVSTDAKFKSVGGVSGFFSGGQIHGGVADKCIKGSTGAPECVNKLANAFEGRKVEVHNGVVFFSNSDRFSGPLGFQKVPASHDYVPFFSIG